MPGFQRQEEAQLDKALLTSVLVLKGRFPFFFFLLVLIKISVFLPQKDDENERTFLNCEDIIRSSQQSVRLAGLPANG